MPPTQQQEQMVSNYKLPDANAKGTAECRFLNAGGWLVEYMPTVIAAGMRGCVSNSNAAALLDFGILKTDHNRLNSDLHDLSVKHMQTIVNMQHNSPVSGNMQGRHIGSP